MVIFHRMRKATRQVLNFPRRCGMIMKNRIKGNLYENECKAIYPKAP